MRMGWLLRSVAAKLTAVLVAAILMVALMVAPAAAYIIIQGSCDISGSWVIGDMAVTSNYYGTGYVNIYKRTSSGNLLVARATGSGKNFYLRAIEPRSSGYSYFETYGFNSSNGSASGGDNC
ncbi:MAG TPA: hypothetical protein VIV12_17480 [Streptosporangiaceae bacterium]